VEPHWDEVAGIVEEAFRLVAPKTVLKLLDDERESDAGGRSG
jgi:hypothetical protein